jgi:nucleotide-binding universal stress UspA family protein
MYANILVATDGSRLSGKAVTHAIALAKALHCKITAFYASHEYPAPAYAEGMVYEALSKREYAALCKKEADKILQDVAQKASAAGVPFAAAQAIVASPWEGILRAARRNKCDAIVMASHGRRGVSALLLGSETQKVLTHSRLPVIVIR